MTTKALFQLFETWRKEQVFTAIDVEFCRFLLQVEPAVCSEVLLAAGLASAAYRDGNVCIQLEELAGIEIFEGLAESKKVNTPALDIWISQLRESSLVGSHGEFKPLILDDANRLYLQRHWKNEQELVQQIIKKVNMPPVQVDTELLKEGLDRLFQNESTGVNWQKVAAVAAVNNYFTVISGGPGTGKTTTVVRLLALLFEQATRGGEIPSIALAAPTGKAAARLESAIREALQNLPIDDALKEQIPTDCRTVHQLLGARLHSAQFRFNAENPLPYDYIIIDEVSMVDQALMSHLMRATLAKTRILLLGDKDQLASVEAGSVLGDICGDRYENQFSKIMQQQLAELDISLPRDIVDREVQPLSDHIILLQKSYRFDTESGIARLAKAINQGKKNESLRVLNDSSYPDVSLVQQESYTACLDLIINHAVSQFQSVHAASSLSKIFEIYRKKQMVSPHRRGPWGVQYINRKIEAELEKQGLKSPYAEWYRGKPVIINENSYSIGLSNGDVGVCWPDDEGNYRIYFELNDEIINVWPSQLPNFSAAYVLTVHKSQGSEYDDMLLILPNKKSKILSRELLYTAITRAKKTVSILGEEAVLREGINCKVARNSGLNDYLWS